MSLTDGILKKFGRESIIKVFKEEVKTYAKLLDLSEKEVCHHIIQHLIYCALPSKSKKEAKVLEIFNERVKFYSTTFPLLTEEVIKEVIKEHLDKNL
ncbi:hypothetical protein KAR26_02735 [Candidatus Parcubacteria bacterium]|nr:hypothetical protein [Candidatus Parcubacteria bacterium]